MPIPSGCCSRLAFRCVRFPAAVLSLRFYRRAGFPVPSVRQSVVRSGFPLCVRFPAAALGLRFYRRAGFPVPSGQSFVRALRCASVFRLRPSACGFSAVPGFPFRPAVSRSFGLSVASVFRLRPSACGFSAVPGFPFRPDSRSFGLSVVRPFSGCGPRLAVLSPCRVSRSVGLPDVSDSLPPTFFAASLSVAPLCLLLSLPLLSLSSSLFAAPLSAPSPALPLRPALGRHYLKSRYSFVYLISEKG